MDVMMGDLVLTEDHVNPVMSALLDRGTGPAKTLAAGFRAALDQLAKPAAAAKH